MHKYVVEYLSPGWTARTGKPTWLALANGVFEGPDETARTEAVEFAHRAVNLVMAPVRVVTQTVVCTVPYGPGEG